VGPFRAKGLKDMVSCCVVGDCLSKFSDLTSLFDVGGLSRRCSKPGLVGRTRIPTLDLSTGFIQVETWGQDGTAVQLFSYLCLSKLRPPPDPSSAPGSVGPAVEVPAAGLFVQLVHHKHLPG